MRSPSGHSVNRPGQPWPLSSPHITLARIMWRVTWWRWRDIINVNPPRPPCGSQGSDLQINRLSGLDNNGATGILVKNLPVNVEIWKRKEGILFVFIELFLTMIQVGPVLVSEEKTVAKLAAPVHSFAAISDASKKSNWPSYTEVSAHSESFS